jgi:hypothetical protein
MTRTDVLIGLVGPVFMSWLAAVIYRRRLYRTFPLFFSYVILTVLISAVRLAVIKYDELFFFVYYGTDALYAIFGLLALYEAFREVFLVFYKVWRRFEILFPAALLVIVILGTWNAALHPAKQAPYVIVVLLAIGKVIKYLQVGVFVLFFTLVWVLGLDWEEYPFGIVLGFTISAAGTWLAYDVRSEFGTKYSSFFKYAPPVAYFGAILVWLATFIRKPRGPRQLQTGLPPEQMLEQAKGYLKILKGTDKNSDAK